MYSVGYSSSEYILLDPETHKTIHLCDAHFIEQHVYGDKFPQQINYNDLEIPTSEEQKCWQRKTKRPTSIRLYFISTFLQLPATQRLYLYHLNLKITAWLDIKLLTLNSPHLTGCDLLIPTKYTYYMIAGQQKVCE